MEIGSVSEGRNRDPNRRGRRAHVGECTYIGYQVPMTALSHNPSVDVAIRVEARVVLEDMVVVDTSTGYVLFRNRRSKILDFENYRFFQP